MSDEIEIPEKAILAAAKAMDGGVAWEDHVAPIKAARLESAEAALRAALAEWGAYRDMRWDKTTSPLTDSPSHMRLVTPWLPCDAGTNVGQAQDG